MKPLYKVCLLMGVGVLWASVAFAQFPTIDPSVEADADGVVDDALDCEKTQRPKVCRVTLMAAQLIQMRRELNRIKRRWQQLQDQTRYLVDQKDQLVESLRTGGFIDTSPEPTIRQAGYRGTVCKEEGMISANDCVQAASQFALPRGVDWQRAQENQAATRDSLAKATEGRDTEASLLEIRANIALQALQDQESRQALLLSWVEMQATSDYAGVVAQDMSDRLLPAITANPELPDSLFESVQPFIRKKQ